MRNVHAKLVCSSTPGIWASNERTHMSDNILPAMTGAEMQTTREFLGLTRGWLGNDLQIGERRLMRMEAEKERIPDAVVARLDEIAVEAKDTVTSLIAQYRREIKRTPGSDVFIYTYKTDEAYAESEEYTGYPAKWHRMCCARVCEAVPGLVIAYEHVPAHVPHQSAYGDSLFSEAKQKPVAQAG